MVRSPSITTEGVGGDSEVGWLQRYERLTLGPGRVIPMSVAAATNPEIVECLRRQLTRRPFDETDGLFALTMEGDLIEASEAYRTRRDLLLARRDATAGRLRFIGPTPTDAAIVLGLLAASSLAISFDGEAAMLGLAGFPRCRTRFGRERFDDPVEAAHAIVAEVRVRSGEVVAAALGVPDEVWAASGRDAGIYRVALELDRPIVGVGASAGLYHPEVGVMFRTEVIVPAGCEVANAVGAAIGSVRLRETSVITRTKKGGFILHRPGPPGVFARLDLAADEGADRLRRLLLSRHADSGLLHESAPLPDVEVHRYDNVVDVGGSEVFVETRLEAVLFISSVQPGTEGTPPTSESV